MNFSFSVLMIHKRYGGMFFLSGWKYHVKEFMLLVHSSILRLPLCLFLHTKPSYYHIFQYIRDHFREEGEIAWRLKHVWGTNSRRYFCPKCWVEKILSVETAFQFCDTICWQTIADINIFEVRFICLISKHQGS